MKVNQSSIGRAGTPVAPLVFAAVRRPLVLILTILREIFDESAYERFLVRRGVNASTASYASFREEQEAGKARRPRCC